MERENKYRDSHINKALNLERESVKRIQSCFKLMNVGDNESLTAIFKVLQTDPCELVRHEAAFCLGEMASTRAIGVLKEVLEHDESVVVKHECLMSLGTLAGKDVMLLIEKYLNNEDTAISSSAQIAKERINQIDFFEQGDDEDDKKYASRLVEILLDKGTSKNDKIQIMFILQNIATVEVVDAISMILEGHSCEIVRHEAAFVLGEIELKEARRALIKCLPNEKNNIVKHEILFALGTTGSDKALKILREYKNDPDYIISESAKIAIDRIEIIERPYRGTEQFD